MNYVIFGESHGPAIGVTLSYVPAGLRLDTAAVDQELARRATGKNALSTARKEPDTVEYLSGIYEGVTTGTPLCAVIRNSGQHSGDYDALRDLARPGHADYAGFVQSGGCNDPRGGGHFSGRLTAPMVLAGAIAKQLLACRGVEAMAHIRQIAGISDASPDYAAPDLSALRAVAGRDFPTLDEAAGQAMQAEILAARTAGDSVGGVVECIVAGLPTGLGAPDFGRNVEGLFSAYLFAIPALKAVEFGAGFGFAALRGSEANDPFYARDGRILTASNRAGGVNGGITNGMPLVFSAAFRPTPSIARPQKTVNYRTGENCEIQIGGRHDPCVVHRAVPVVEAAAALAACELMQREGKL